MIYKIWRYVFIPQRFDSLFTVRRKVILYSLALPVFAVVSVLVQGIPDTVRDLATTISKEIPQAWKRGDYE